MNSIITEDMQFITKADLPWRELEGRTVLVTGANGFLPAYVVETLLYLNDRIMKKKINVIGLVRNRDKALSRFQYYHERNDLKIVVQDVTDPFCSEGDIDYIIHAASQASPKYYGNDPVGTILPNVAGTANLLELARAKKSRCFLFFSSGEVYGEVQGDKIPTREQDYGYLDPIRVRSCYAESKRMGEAMCVAWCHQFGVPAKIVRPFHTYGPGMDLKDGRVFADFVADVLSNRDIVLKSDGSALRAFCYLADAVRGFFTVLFKGSPAQAYNVGNDRGEVSILELAQILASISPITLRVVRDEAVQPTGYIKSTIVRNCPDISKICALGWKPMYSVRDGFERTIRSFTV